jgi:beta-glucanase (GH16 family)
MHRQPKLRFAGLALVLVWMLWSSGSVSAAARSTSGPNHGHRAIERQRRFSALQRRRRLSASQRQIRTVRRAAASGPSGVPIPTGNPRGWREVFSDDFTGSGLGWQWTAYWGQPGGDPGGFFDPTHVTVSGSQLVISAYHDPVDEPWDAGPNTYVTGGVSSSPSFAQTYGKYLVRFRIDRGQGIALAILLWPQSNSWPPEIDFAEDNGANRQTDYATLHYGSNNTQVQKSVAVNLTRWHTLGVEWTGGRLVYTLDGRNWATVTNANVPSIPMVLDIQTQGWACHTSTWEQCPDAGTPARVNLDVDWVVAYAQS